jgi:hypothetical protein
MGDYATKKDKDGTQLTVDVTDSYAVVEYFDKLQEAYVIMSNTLTDA